jgi:hypothetical protein
MDFFPRYSFNEREQVRATVSCSLEKKGGDSSEFTAPPVTIVISPARSR